MSSNYVLLFEASENNIIWSAKSSSHKKAHDPLLLCKLLRGAHLVA